ncbi:MAG: GNAT family N-acetyltransferase [Hyphomonadaceae bacterium]|jgi:GNAT superfamily N-acetyltransferase|nr:GNAT family N-acetyltransferase [Hyphomonadaceae bacterium]
MAPLDLRIEYRPAGLDCASILSELPEWFGIPEANADFVRMAESEGAWTAESSGETLGIMLLVDRKYSAMEVYLLAVRPRVHRRGVGRTLVNRACSVARGAGKRYLTVKTLGPSISDAPYRETRAFYVAMGFDPLEELISIWRPGNPCLYMIRPV